MPRVLIVEDEGLLRELAVDEFTDAGFAVEEATNGDEALTLLKSQGHFDLLFTDIRMPGRIDGWELGRLASEIAPSIRIIYVTGYSEQPRRLGANEMFVPKPYRCEHVVHLINGWA